MTEAPKDYWPVEAPKADRFDTIAILCLLSAVGGFLIGWTI